MRLCRATARSGTPEIMNTGRAPQFTGSAWITALTVAGVRISMYGRGRCMDNIFIEPLWRSLKQEAIYLEELTDGFKAYRIIREWMAFYNAERPHSALQATNAEGSRLGRSRSEIGGMKPSPDTP